MIYLALGSNLGNRAANIAMALRMMLPLVRVEGVSRLYESPAADGSAQPLYYNAAASVVTGLDPEQLLAHLKRIEHAIGRRRAPLWGPRPIDIDIALYDDRTLETEALTIPHPHLAERAFVVRPLLDLDPMLRLPDGRRLSDLAAAAEALTVMADGDWWVAPNAIGVPPLATI